MRINIIQAIIFVFMFACNNILSQDIQTNYQHYDIRDGLAQMKIHAIHEDKIGNLWIGTRNGLSKFNGENFTNYYKEDGLCGNRILDIISDSTGKLILATNNGISIFDGVNSDNILGSIAAVKGQIEFYNEKSFFVFSDPSINSYYISLSEHFIERINFSNIPKRVGSKKMSEIGVDLTSIDTNLLSTTSRNAFKNKVLNSRKEQLKAIVKDVEVSFNYAQKEHNLFRRNIKTDHYFPKHEISIPSGSALNNSSELLGISQSGDYWNFRRKQGLSGIIELKTGQIVVPSEAGLYILSKPWFRHFDKNKLSNVWSVIESSDGEFYTNSFDNPIHKISPNFQIEEIPFKKALNVIQFLTNSTRDKNGVLYFPHHNGILIKRHNSYDTICNGRTYYSLFYDHIRDHIVGCMTNGISIIKDKKPTLINLEGHGLRSGEYFNSISQDKYNRYWMTSYSGLCCYDPDIEDVIEFEVEMKKISLGGCFGMYQNDSLLWLGLEEGLAVVNINTMKLIKISSVVINSMVKGIINYNDSLLLIGAKKGLYIFNKKRYLQKGEIDITEINKSHGFFGIEPGFDCFYRDSKERIWITASNHLSILTPREDFIKKHPLIPNIIKINEQNLAFNHTYQTYTNKSGIDEVIIEYEAIGMMRPNKVMFQYQFDEQPWSAWTLDKKILLNDLSHGKHLVKLRVGPTDLPFEYSRKDQVHFCIYLPFYRRQWLQVLFFALGSLALLYYLVNYYVIKRKQRLYVDKIKENQYLKNQILLAELNPHFIFNALSTIQSNVLKDNKKKASDQIVRLSNLIRAILSSSFRGNLNSSSDRALDVPVANEIELIELYLNFEMDKHPNRFNFEILYSENLDLNGIFIPPMLIQPLVENAIKHGVLPLKDRNGLITINIRDKNDIVTIEIIDNGIGIEASILRNAKKLGKPVSLGAKIISERIEVLRALGYDIKLTQQSSNSGTTNTIKYRNE